MSTKAPNTAIPGAAIARQFGQAECCRVAGNPPFSRAHECRSVARRPTGAGSPLDGNLARRTSLADGIIWDDELTGFGLRVRASGYRSWIIKYRERRQQRFVTLGSAAKLDAATARSRARALLERAALDGLPTRPKIKAAPLLRDYVAEFWRDYAPHWKPSTQKSNLAYIRRELDPTFGDLALDTIVRADVLRWRDDMAERGGAFNRALPVLAVMLGYAEQLGYRRKGSNPCKGMPRHKRTLPERYLSAVEYRRLARAMDEAEFGNPLALPAIKLLMFTGARSNEIATLRWENVQPPRLMLPDSKTGAKIIWLNEPAQAVLDGLPVRRATGLIFTARDGETPIRLGQHWDYLRRRAALPDVRLHDLRHSFASIAIADGMSLTMIGKLLGHALPETTARYAHLADTVIADAAERVSSGLAAALGFDR